MDDLVERVADLAHGDRVGAQAALDVVDAVLDALGRRGLEVDLLGGGALIRLAPGPQLELAVVGHARGRGLAQGHALATDPGPVPAAA